MVPMDKSAVTSVCWVPRGRCRAHPTVPPEDDDEELRQAALELGDDPDRVPRGETAETEGGKDEFDMENYDNDSEDEGMQFFSVLNNDQDLAKERDPHLKGGVDSESDSEDYYEIKPDDKVFIAASCDADTCNIEVYVYDDEEPTMYVHHDLMLGAYPLCIEWLDHAGTADVGSFAAVGMINHKIEIWDLDRLDPLRPAISLGTPEKASKTKTTKKKKKGDAGPKAHDGPILCLNGSPFNRSVLASGGGDNVVKVWDVTENACVNSYTHHTDKVQCVRWHPTEQAVLMTASFDRHLALLDARHPGQVVAAKLSSEAESAIWSRHQPFQCFASTDDGSVICFDVRKIASKAAAEEQRVWTLQAHEAACTSVQDSPVRDLMVTSSLDGSAKIWKMTGNVPSLVYSKDLQAGPLFSCNGSVDVPALFCFGGRCPVVWDLTSEDLLSSAFDFGQSA